MRSFASAGTDSVLRVFDRRGGGSNGFAFVSSSSVEGMANLDFSSSSCSSFADLKDAAGEEGALLSIDVDRRLLKVAERLESCDMGRPWGPVIAFVLIDAS